MDIPGIGPKTALRLSQELGISTIDELEKAILEGKVAGLFRMGEKTADNILRRIQAMRSKERRIPLGQALPIVEGILADLGECRDVHNLIPAGSLRRFKETVGDIDIMGTADDPEPILQAFTELPLVEEVLLQGATKSSIIVGDGLQVDLRIVEHDAFGSLLQYFTGSKDHNIALRERAVRNGLKLSEYGITTLKTGVLEKFDTEEGYYHRLGLELIPPELREGRDEIERAEKSILPKLVQASDIKGDLHIHSEWSDGHNSIEEMALAAKEMGYRYIAITDHSVGRGIAHGLNEERLRQQMAEIKGLNQRLEGIRLLSGIEVDIRADGSLDLPDGILSQLDIVAAAVHSAMGQDEERMTRRVLKAMENPNVDILAHPTCRLLGEREAINLNMEELFKAALRTDTALEINARPERLDLKDIYVLRAKELGVKIVANTDAHRASQLDVMRFGVGVARRGWCEAQHILNTKPLEKVEAFLKHGGD
jgi:DNA polymerase (family 10)